MRTFIENTEEKLCKQIAQFCYSTQNIHQFVFGGSEKKRVGKL